MRVFQHPAKLDHPDLHVRRDCRLCGSTSLEQVLDLGQTPLANEFVPAEQSQRPQDLFPLSVHLCGRCGHAQLVHVVNPERLFRNYVYVSGTSPAFIDHFRRYADAMLRLTKMPLGSDVLEIGSNDGTLLQFFKQAGMRVLGIDPARAIATQATERGIPTMPEFLTIDLAKHLTREGWRPKLIAANNVFAHADDLHAIVESVKELLAPDGLFVFEVSYLMDVFENTLFDTMYHEHLSYHTVRPLRELFRRHGMELTDAQRVDSHGGSLRGIAQVAGGPWPVQAGVAQRIAEETTRGLFDAKTYRDFAQRIQQRKTQLVTLLRELRGRSQRIIGFGAPAKATTLMYHFGIGPELIEAIIDDSPWKQGMYSPGQHLPIVPSSVLYEWTPRPQYALLLAWNFAGPIMAKHQAFHEAGGRFIIPLPEVEVR